MIIDKFEYHFVILPSGSGCGTTCRETESIMNKRSVITISNADNNCFWYALACLMHPNNRTIRVNKNKKARIKTALHPYKGRVSLEQCDVLSCEVLF